MTASTLFSAVDNKITACGWPRRGFESAAAGPSRFFPAPAVSPLQEESAVQPRTQTVKSRLPRHRAGRRRSAFLYQDQMYAEKGFQVKVFLEMLERE